MTNNKQKSTSNYQLLDSGNGRKLEQFGVNRIIRPDTNCVWRPQLAASDWGKASAEYHKTHDDSWTWTLRSNFKQNWHFEFDYKHVSIKCHLKASGSKNIGIFPEQMANWTWIIDQLSASDKQLRVLNLFGYTGAATLCAAAAGAQVIHVDASKPAMTQAKENAQTSDLGLSPIRWIVDDCTAFVQREVRRKQRYDAIIMDPPAFGRSHKGKVFEFEKDIIKLLESCTQLLAKRPAFFLFNGYSMGFSATVLANVLADFYPEAYLEVGELTIGHAHDQRLLPCSLYVRFK